MYIVDSYIGNDVTVRQGYKTRPGAMRAAKSGLSLAYIGK